MSPHLSGYKAVCLRSMDSIVKRKAPNTLPMLLLAILLVALAGCDTQTDSEDPKNPDEQPGAEIPVEPIVEPPAESPAEIPAELPVIPPAESPVEPPAELPVDPPVETPVEPPVQIDTDPGNEDSDGNDTNDGDEDANQDGLSNETEQTLGNDTLNPDSDANGVSDGQEVGQGQNPIGSDSDNNGIDDGDEDNDSDGLINRVEIAAGLNPNDAQDADTDLDNDGLSNRDELMVHGTNVNDADTDNDGLPDGQELDLSLDPTTADSDNDGILDSEEDADNDGLSNRQELALGTDPMRGDTDSDGLSDGLEAALGTNALSSDSDNDGTPDGNEDFDGDGLTNLEELETHGSDPTVQDSDNDGLNDGTEVSLGLDPANGDSDGDNINDAVDTYPTDAQRSRLVAVTGVQINGAGPRIELSWQPHPEADRVVGYQVRRSTNDSSVAETVLSAGINRLSFVDESLENGTLYDYQVLAISDNGVESNAGQTVSWFVAYNTVEIQAPEATRDEQGVNLQWQPLSGSATVDGYRLYRSTLNGPATALADIPAGASVSYTDTESDQGTAYSYQLSTLLRFTHPRSGEVETVEGPQSPTIELEPFVVYSMQLRLENAQALEQGRYRRQVNGDSDRIMQGAYTDARGNVRISAINNASGQSVSTVATTKTTDGINAGNFTLALPANGEWEIIAQDLHPTQSRNRKNVSLVLTVDTTAPVITVDEDQEMSTAGDEIVVRGSISDESYAIASVYALSQRFDGIEIGGSLGADNRFSVTVPLLHGPNEIELLALDGSGNRARHSILIEREVSEAPVLNVLQPNDGDTTTAARITVTGTIYTDQAIDQLQLSINDEPVTPVGQGGVEGYTFSSSSLALHIGLNTLRIEVQSPGGTASSLLQLTRLDDSVMDAVLPPTISIISPLPGAVTNSRNTLVEGQVTSSASSVSLRIDGVPTLLSDRSGGHFSTLVPGQTCDGLTQTLELVANDSNDQSTVRSLTVTCDNRQPVISLLSPGNLNVDADNRVVENPLPVSGIVVDENISSLTINGQSVSLSPTATADEYRFSAVVQLSPDTQNTLSIEARDRAGNASTQTYGLIADLTVNASFINPVEGSVVAHSALPVTLDVIAQIEGLQTDHTVNLIINDTEAQTMSVSGNAARLMPSAVLNEGENTLLIEVRDGDENVVAIVRRTLASEVTTIASFALTGSNPAANSLHQAPNTPITLMFNRSDVDFDAVTVNVTQTVHGNALSLGAQQGAEFTAIPAPEIVNINVDRAEVAGSTVVFADDTMISFYPEQSLHYGARVFVDVEHAGETLSRFSFDVQDLPTRVGGVLTDTLGEPLNDVEVQMPELGLSTSTSHNGNFDFGAGETQLIPIPSGRYLLLLNPGQANPSLGTSEHWVNVQQGRLNKLGRVPLPRILSSEPFIPLSGGRELSLHEGAIQLDLTEASLRFADGRDTGNAQVQLLLSPQLPHSVSAAAIPGFAWHLQPSGIEVTGEVSLTINIPPFRGGYAHVPPTGIRVALIGFDRQSKQLMPIGTGRVEGRQIHSTGKLVLASLDYLAYALVPASVYQALLDWEAGDIQLLAQLQGRLLEATE